MTSPEKIVAQFLQIRKFKTRAFNQGWVTEEEYEKAQREVVLEYSNWLCAGDQEMQPYAILTLLHKEAEQRIMEENMYQGVTYN